MATTDVLQALRGRVLEDPDDLEALRVFADALMEGGDDLGFHIAQSLRDEEAPLPEALEARLLGRLHRAVSSFEVRHGFLRGVSLHSITTRELRGLVGCSEWEGVTSLGLAFRRRPRHRAMSAAAVLPLLGHPVCRHVRVVERLGFEAFVALCDVERRFDRLQLVDLPHWGVNTPPRHGTLSVRELVLAGRDDEFGAVLAWLRTWGRAVYDRVEVLELGATYRGHLDSVLAHPGAALRQVVDHDWTATHEAGGWHVELRAGAPGRCVSLDHFHASVRELGARMERTTNCANRFTVRIPGVTEELLDMLEAAAANRPIEIHQEGPLELAVDEAPF